MESKRILVVGGFGYIGRELVAKLLRESYEVTVLSRNPEKNKQINVIKGSVLDKEFLTHRLKGFDIIIHLAAIVRSFNKSRYQENVLGLRNIIEVMYLNKIKKLIYFSTQNVYLKKTGPYGDSKKKCEKIIISSDLDYVIVRPNYVYGVDKHNDFYRLIRFIKTLRICPIIGNGHNRFQPVNKTDVARITVNLITQFNPKSIVDFSGNTTISINQIVDFLQGKLNLKFIRLYIPIIFLKLFKRVIPFDIDGFADDRISPIKSRRFDSPSNDLTEDIEQMVKL